MPYHKKITVKLCDLSNKFVGQIQHFTSDGVLVTIPQSTLLNSTAEAELTFYHHTKGKMIYKALVQDVYGDQVLFCNLESVATVQKRDETRVPFPVTVLIKKIYIKNDVPVALQKTLLMQTLDISASGIGLSCEFRLPEGLQLAFDISIESEQIPCFAKIVRVRSHQNRYYYGCKLITPENSQDKIRKYVFKLQIEEKKRAKDCKRGKNDGQNR